MYRELTSFGQGLEAASFSRLQSLYLNYSASLTLLTPFGALRQLSMAGYALSGRLLDDVCQLQALTKLDISHYSPNNVLSDGSLERLAVLKALRSLDLGGALHVSDRGLQSLAALQHLSELDLSSCGITNTGVEQLSHMQSLAKLKCLRCPRVDLAQIRNTTVKLCLYRGHREQELTPTALLQ